MSQHLALKGPAILMRLRNGVKTDWYRNSVRLHAAYAGNMWFALDPASMAYETIALSEAGALKAARRWPDYETRFLE